MKYKFKIGDTINLNPEKYNESYDEWPKWNSSESYIIVKFDDKTDSNGLPIVILNKSFVNYYDHRTITTYYLLPDIKKLRKLKLKKIYESRR